MAFELLENLSLTDEDTMDVTFKCKNGVSIKAHRLALAEKNSVFLTMFFNDTFGSKNGIINIEDCDAEAFKIFLKYLYTGDVKKEDVTINLLQISDKYLDDSLKEKCEDELIQTINNDNVLDRFLAAVDYNCQHSLKNSACIFIRTNLNGLMKDPTFFDSLYDNKEAMKTYITAPVVNNDWILGDNLTERKILSLSEETKKVTFKLKNGDSVEVDRIFIAQKNRVFLSILLNTTTEMQDGFISIEDCDAEAFKVFLKYLREGVIVKEDISIDLLQISHKYLDDSLKKICEKTLCEDINDDNLVRKFVAATAYNCDDLKKRTLFCMEQKVEELKPGILEYCRNEKATQIICEALLKYRLEGENADENTTIHILGLCHNETKDQLHKNSELDSLKKKCEEELCKDINDDNVLKKFKLAIEYNCYNLKINTFYYIQKHLEELVHKPEMLELYSNKEAIASLLIGLNSGLRNHFESDESFSDYSISEFEN